MIRFRSITECVVDYTPPGRRNGIDCQERCIKGLIGLTEDGEIYRFNYSTKDWSKIPVLVRPQEPPVPPSSSSTTES